MISEYFITPFIYIRVLSLTIYAVSLHPFVLLGSVVISVQYLPY